MGKPSTGHMTYPGYEDFAWTARIVAIDPMTHFAYEWPATGGDKELMKSGVPVPEWTLVEFILEPLADGTRINGDGKRASTRCPSRGGPMSCAATPAAGPSRWRISEPMPSADQASPDRSTPPAALFAALGDTTRLALVERLSAGGAGQSISRLGAGLPMSRQAIRKHLSVLEDAGLVGARPSGREMLYALRANRSTRRAPAWMTLPASGIYCCSA